ncbi:adenosine deaminase [Marinitenerispora sediminis]|uniref:Adenosine deaminase n=1 Tax=Marinitenerispora sediminis TaxID=1931232 RepID=A0A368T4C5_9ACTN|nr:adenosine deaminase [Marinitenerispora sediminis]RCV50348.1 adenosine deaminase [Marinitenerispora sediminis]RCV53625.1 adenosine deaminase [Marinitenerispora sediminis]RCV57920.1 adenosine deaminase [Marinitenerispora sediminis]
MRSLTELPKVDLHVHLESTIRWSTVREIAAANGAGIPEDGPPAAFAGFRAFADHGALIRGCLRRPEDFARVAVEFCADEAEHGVRYAEVTFTAASHEERLGRPGMPLESVLRGLAEGRDRYGVECRVILDHSRRRSVRRAWRTLELARRYAADGVVAIGLAGDESYPLAPFAEACAAAREAGVRLVHHAGEAAGPASVREAVEVGHAERLGHGFRALEDPELVAELRERAIPLEVCPSSNVALGLVPSLAAHPLPRLLHAGLHVTVNTDIPAVVGTTLTAEYARISTAFGFTEGDLGGLSRAAIDASFAPEGTKARLHREVDAWLADGEAP